MNDLRTLLARRNTGAGQSARPTSTPTPTSTSNDDGDSHVPVERIPETQVFKSTGDKDEAASSGARINKTVTWGTPTPTTTASVSESGTSSSADTRRRRTISSVPFEAFISPVQPRGSHVESGDKGKSKEITQAADPFISPTAARSRASLGGSSSASLQRPKGRVSGHARRESASAAFEAYIVRDSPRRMSGAITSADADTGTGIKLLSQPPRQPRFSEGSESLPSSSVSVASPVIPGAVPVLVPESDVGADGCADDTNAMDVDAEDDSTHVDDGMALGEGDVEPDEADTLLELASVHLSQPEAVADKEAPECSVDEASKVGVMDAVMDEVRSARVLSLLALLRALVSRLGHWGWKTRSHWWLMNLDRKLGTRWL